MSLNIFASMTSNKQEQHNLWMLGLSSVMSSLAIPLYAGATGTAFNAAYGITPTISAMIVLPMRIVTLVTMICSSAFIDRVRNRILFNAVTIVLSSLGGVSMLLRCLGPDSFRTVAGIATIEIIIGLPVAVVSSIRGGADAMVQCRVIHNAIRGRFWSIFGIISGLLGIPVGIYITCLLKNFNVRMANVLAVVPGMLFALLAGYFAMQAKELPELQVQEKKEKEPFFTSIRKIITMPQFRIMMPANLMRSMGDGCVGYALLLAMQRYGLSQEYAGYTQTLTSAAPFLGYVILGLTLDRFGAAVVLPVTDLLMGLGMIFMVAIPYDIALPFTLPFIGNTLPYGVVFLIATGVYQVLLITECSAIPLAHYEVLPNDVMGAFSNVRLMLMNVAGMLSGTLAGLALGYFSPASVFIVCAIIKVSAGILYSYGIIKLRKHNDTPAAA